MQPPPSHTDPPTPTPHTHLPRPCDAADVHCPVHDLAPVCHAPRHGPHVRQHAAVGPRPPTPTCPVLAMLLMRAARFMTLPLYVMRPDTAPTSESTLPWSTPALRRRPRNRSVRLLGPVRLFTGSATLAGGPAAACAARGRWQGGGGCQARQYCQEAELRALRVGVAEKWVLRFAFLKCIGGYN